MNLLIFIRRMTLLMLAAPLAFSPAASGVQAQAADPAALAAAYAANAKENAQQLRKFSWKMRVQPTLDGQPKPPTIYLMRFDMDGVPQKTVITSGKPPAPSGLGKRVKAKKIGEFNDWMDTLAETVKRYMSPTPGNMMDFFAKAVTTNAADGTSQVAAGSFLQPGDNATFWISKTTQAAVRYSFNTTLSGEAVQGTVEYAQIPGGPQIAARTTVIVPARKVSLKVENFDYIKQP